MLSSWALYVFFFAALAVAAFAISPFATFLGVTLVIAAVASAVWSAFQQQRNARRWASISSFYTLTPEQFEHHVARMFEYQGYSTMLTPRTGDQGVDVIARKREHVIGIQCKRYADPAPNTAVQAVHSGSKYYGCNEAMLVCLGGFSRAASELARVVSVTLIDGDKYADMVHAMTNGNGASTIKALPSARVAAFAAVVLLVGISLICYGVTAHPTPPAMPAATSASTKSANHVLVVIALILIAVGISNTQKRWRRRRHR